jgi:hypothetical protein
MLKIYTHRLLALIPLVIVCGSFLGLAPEVQAYTANADLSLSSLPDENYDSIISRAETAARAAVQRSFDQDILVTDVDVIVSAEKNGQIATLLQLKISRTEWKKLPDPQRWVTYFKMTQSLLFADDRSNSYTTNINTPTPTPTPTSTAPNRPDINPRFAPRAPEPNIQSKPESDSE